MTAPKAERARQWHRKVRTGCTTCKQRRVKCTEEKPTCRRCIGAGRRCEYPTPDSQASASSSSKSSSTSTSSRSESPPTRPPHHSSPLNELSAEIATLQEKRSLCYFREKTAMHASAYARRTRPFWEYVVPQLVHSSEAIRHAVIALSSLNEAVTSPAGDNLALLNLQSKHYHAALRELTYPSSASQVTPEILLVANAIFTACGNFVSPFRQSADQAVHANSGIQILTERMLESGQAYDPSPLIDKHCLPLLIGWELVQSLLISPISASGKSSYNIPTEPPEPQLPPVLSNLHEARRLFFSIVCWRYRSAARPSAENPNAWTLRSPAFLETRSKFLQWYNLLLAFASALQQSPLHSSENASSDGHEAPSNSTSASGSAYESHRIQALISQFQLLMVTFVYSARTDLHPKTSDQLRPNFVDLSTPNAVGITYDLPPRWVLILRTRGYGEGIVEDPMHIRLWPILEIADPLNPLDDADVTDPKIPPGDRAPEHHTPPDHFPSWDAPEGEGWDDSWQDDDGEGWDRWQETQTKRDADRMQIRMTFQIGEKFSTRVGRFATLNW